MPTVEDYFDDDTDLPLPSSSRHLPNTGLKGALLEEIGDELDLDLAAEQGRGEYGANSKAPPPSANAKGKVAVRDDPGELRPSGQQQPRQLDPNTPMGGFMGDMMKFQEAEEARMAKIKSQFGNASVATDAMEYKAWNTVYPLYFDAKASVKDGRRVPRKSSLWWPLAAHIARAAGALGIPAILEPEKTHPADWENPGRVKVQFEKDGIFLNPKIKNRSQLYAQIAIKMQAANPTLVPVAAPVAKAPEVSDAKPKTAGKGKQQSQQSKGKGKGKATATASPESAAIIPAKLPTRPPPAPQPTPVLDVRLPLHSPLASTGVAVSAVKRDIEQEKDAKKKGLLSSGDGEAPVKEKQPKMKRVVVRGGRR